MEQNFKLSELEYHHPDCKAMQEERNALALQVKNASSYEEVRRAIFRNNEIEIDFQYYALLAFQRMYHDCTDEFYAKESQTLSEEEAMMDTSKLYEALLSSKYRKEIDEEFGVQFLRLKESDVKVHSKGKELQAKEQQLIAKYQQLKASLKVNFNGETLSEAQIFKYYESKDRQERIDARKAHFTALNEKKEEFEKLLRELVNVRNEIAKANGFDNFLDYANLEKGRFGYGEKELNAFCEQVKKDLVPFCQRMYEAQAKRLGLEKLKFYDMKNRFLEGNPEPAGDADYLLDAATKMYDELSEETKEFFHLMLDHEMLDIKASENKIAGMGFCDSVDKLNICLIFGNCNGTIDDISVLTHEVGHAFQAYLAMKNNSLKEYSFAVNDAAEIPSKTMEQFTYPYAEYFLGDDADRFRFAHLQGALEEICAYCEINELENYIYTHPDAPLEEWIRMEEEIQRRYNPLMDTSEVKEYVDQGCMLFKNMALYMFPKYVISYSLSAMCALQFKKMMDEDSKKAWDSYLTLCKNGGSLGYAELLKSSGLKLAYEDGIVAEVTEYAKEILLKEIK